MHRDQRTSGGRWHVHVCPAAPRWDVHGRDVLADVRHVGLTHIEGVRSSRLYFLEGQLSEAEVRLLAAELLTDPVTERFTCTAGFSARDDSSPSIEVHYQPGVMNPVAQSTLAAARRLLAAKGVPAGLREVQTARRYEVIGARSAAELDQIAGRVLANDCIETVYVRGLGRSDALPDRFPVPPDRPFVLRRAPMRGLTDPELAVLSRDGHLFLSLEEMRSIRDHFATLQRDPTDLELETLAQTWSEHCVHKTLKSAVEYCGPDFGRAGEVSLRFENLLKDTIVAATHHLNRDWCLSVFVDNAGVVAFDDEYGIAFKVETHNHPSAIEPYGGAATGVGGCIRDVMGCGLGAKPIASTDVFCLAPPHWDPARLPAGVLHPRRVLKGVVGGVRDYGNRMGIPTVNGAIYFEPRYLANPLVFCGCVGLIPRNRIHKKPRPGDRVVVAGGRTGRDGIHGATFSSAELTDQHADEFSHAVQIGNAIEEKKLLDALLLARDHARGCLYSAVTDCGAGGLSSAVGEMGAELGAVVDLDDVPLKYAGLRYDEIWISEAQERMVFAVPPERLDDFLGVFAAEEVEATVIGTFTDDRVLRVRFRGETVGELDMCFLHQGLPRSTRTARWAADSKPVPHGAGGPVPKAESLNERLLRALSDLNVASKEWVIRQYDHEVQGRSVVKPLMGPGAGPSDAAVLRPRYDRYRGIAVGCGLRPDLADVDPYWMAVAGVDEALRNVICVGADPNRTAILDNFCWPKVDSEESMGALVRACRGAADAAVAFGLPFISGKDSLNNQFSMSAAEAQRTGLPAQLAIPYTLLISALGIVEDVRRCVTPDLKQADDVLVLASAPVDRVGLTASQQLHDRVAGLIARGVVRAAHDVSDGGIAATLAEMCIGSQLGATVSLMDDAAGGGFFDAPMTTYILEMTSHDAAACGLPVIGRVEHEPRLRIDAGSAGTIDLTVADLAEAWRRPLREGG
ncbi:MAG: phosphoribosylformylglycinamidine synthase [Planctomycetes bacterium]|nr:phosphoribosylformylglycinamidine synthase [Planctomycetota bacterium]